MKLEKFTSQVPFKIDRERGYRERRIVGKEEKAIKERELRLARRLRIQCGNSGLAQRLGEGVRGKVERENQKLFKLNSLSKLAEKPKVE